MAQVVEDVQLLHIAPGYCYRQRVHPITGSRGSNRKNQQQQQQQQDWQQAEEEEELQILTIEDEEVDEALITQEGDGSYATQLSVDSQLLPFIIGRSGNTKKQIEQETGTTLLIPKGTRKEQHPHTKHHHHQQQQQQQSQQQVLLGSSQSETVTIKGSSKQAVSSARVRTQLLVDSVIGSRMLDWTHFVSIPLANKQTAAKLEEFQQKVMSQPDAAQQGFDPSIFIKPQQLHLTLLMLKLYSDEARQKATQALQGLQPKVSKLLGGQPLRLSLQGLDYMSDDPTDMHVLYLKVAESGGGQKKLQALCDLVMEAFEQAGLLLAGQSKHVKLHATIINTRHRRPDSRYQQPQPTQQQQQQQQGGGGRHQHNQNQQQQRQGFNGKHLLQDFEKLALGEYEVPALHISQRGVFDSNSGYYGCMASLPLAGTATSS